MCTTESRILFADTLTLAANKKTKLLSSELIATAFCAAAIYFFHFIPHVNACKMFSPSVYAFRGDLIQAPHFVFNPAHKARETGGLGSRRTQSHISRIVYVPIFPPACTNWILMKTTRRIT